MDSDFSDLRAAITANMPAVTATESIIARIRYASIPSAVKCTEKGD